MRKDRVQRYVDSLERTIQNNYQYVKETIGEFQKLCCFVAPGKIVPQEIITDIRKINEEIEARLAEIKEIQQLLQGKYRAYYRSNTLRERKITEFGFIARYYYSKFEYTLMQIGAMKRLREKEPPLEVDHKRKSLQWFSSKESQVTFIRNLKILAELDYEPTPEAIGEERREVTGERALTLFLFNGDSLSLDELQSQIRFREHDIMDRSDRNELRGVMTHLRKADSSVVEKMFQHYIGNNGGATKLKCVLLPIYSKKDLEVDIPYLIKAALQEMNEGEVKTLMT